MLVQDIFMLIMTWPNNQYSDQMHCWLMPIIIFLVGIIVTLLVLGKCSRLAYQKLKGTASAADSEFDRSLQGQSIEELEIGEDLVDTTEDEEDSGLGTAQSISSSPSTSLLNESNAARNTRWTKLIEEGDVFKRALVEQPPKEWSRRLIRRRLLLGSYIECSPVTKRLLRAK